MLKLHILLIFSMLIVFGVCTFTAEDCEKDAEDMRDRCLDLRRVYHWNHGLRRCERGVYGGCNKTPNNFKTLEECQEVAEPLYCRKGTEEGSTVCLALLHVFQWNNDLQKCEQAIYGGCHPTSNNFETLKECCQVAEPVCKVAENEADNIVFL